MARAKAHKSEREPSGEPMATEQASIQQTPAEMARARVWELHLRGIPKVRIARALNLDRGTVAKIIQSCYAESASDQKQFSPARKLGEAVARMRRVQEQAWDDHDADDERERQVLDASLAQHPADSDGKAAIRFQSQRSQYLRIILDAEKEIARLEGLYEGMLDIEGAVGFVVVRQEQGAQIATTVSHRPILPAGLDGGQEQDEAQ